MPRSPDGPGGEDDRPDGSPEVVYLAGWGRSGSTVLGAILGELDGWLSVGELRYLFREQVTCGCSLMAAECPYWQAVVARAEEMLGGLDRARYAMLQDTVLSPKRVPSILRHPERPELVELARITDALRRSAAIQAGARVLVDASKHPGDAALVASRGGLVVHLVRDPRATAYSWDRRRREGQLAIGFAASTGRWLEWNALSEVVAARLPRPRKIRIRYEDFVADPAATVASIAALAGETVDTSALASGVATLGGNHMVSSNPAKFRTGRVPLVLDSAWRSELSRTEQAAVTAVAWPLMARYGYLRRRGTRRPG